MILSLVRSLFGRSRRQARERIFAEIHAECEKLNARLESARSPFARVTFWTDARWYEYVSREEVDAIAQSYGFGPLRSYRDAIAEQRAA